MLSILVCQMASSDQRIHSWHQFTKKIAEQRSFSTAWDLLHEQRFNDLRLAICPNNAEANRFSQLVINSIMATDLFDEELRAARPHSWNKAYGLGSSSQEEESPKQMLDLKATIVLEHLMQAANLCHAMQHWHIYEQWNTKLHEETFQAFSDGRSDKDPGLYWYQGEIDFFDKYVMPPAKRINQLGCFGSFGEESLQKALQNREEWRVKGFQIVRQMRANAARLNGSDEELAAAGLDNMVNSEVSDLDNLEEEFRADMENPHKLCAQMGGCLVRMTIVKQMKSKAKGKASKVSPGRIPWI